ncbi:MAG: hypothetical protein NC224_01085, partial [Bacteroides sp.]|nr:hypothetical protein [Bacteroides sp.]
IHFCFSEHGKIDFLLFEEAILKNTRFWPEKRTFQNSFTLKINFVHLEKNIGAPCKKIFSTL